MMPLRQTLEPLEATYETTTAVLMRLSYELHALAASTEKFHDLAFGGNVVNALEDAAFVQATQDIDLTQQILSNLSQYVECLALAASKDWLFDTEPASSLVTLSDLRDRLSGKSTEAHGEPVEDDIWF